VNETNGPPEPPKAAHLVEAVLLTSTRPVGVGALSSASGLPEAAVRSSLTDLARRYSPGKSGIVLRNVAGGYLLSTNPACSAAVERFRDEARPAPLSGAAYEVLSCAIYYGPLTRSAISGVRGVNSDAVVRNLIDRGLLAGASSREDFPSLETLVSEEELARVRKRLRIVGDGSPAELPETP
jgi:segregation and condensation protein B